MRVMLCQPGVQYPHPGTVSPHLNVPLALGYLVGGLEVHGLLDQCRVEILDAFYGLYAADAVVVEEILAHDPDVVGFSCYCWNIDRSLFIAARLAARKPGLHIVLGGPEAGERAREIMEHHPTVTAVVRGEGEDAFPLLLRQLQDDRHDPIPGVCRRVRGDIHIADDFAVVGDIRRFPSPYLRNHLDPRDYGSLNIETVRGCIFHCHYCYYPKRFKGVRDFPVGRIEQEVKLAVDRGIGRGYLMDPVFNLPGRTAPLCRAVARGDKNGQLRFQTEARPELITPDTIAHFRAAHIDRVEIGLQSTNPTTLENINRRLRRGAFERAVDLLLGAGLHVRVGVIVGLPGDHIADVDRTLDYVLRLGLTDIQCFLLQVLPGTPLRRNARRLGLQFNDRPPYYVTQTREMTHQDLRIAHSHARRKAARTHCPGDPGHFNPDLTLSTPSTISTI